LAIIPFLKKHWIFNDKIDLENKMRNLSILFLFVFLISACGTRQQADEPVAAKPVEKIPVKVTQVTAGTATEQLSVRGEIAPLWSVDIYADGAGKIIQKNVNVGDPVKAGQVLALMKQDIPGMEFTPSPIESSVNGTLIASMAEIGAMVTPQRPVFTISELDSVLVLARVLESDLHNVSVNSACRITVDALPDKQFNGRVRKINPLLDTRSRTATVEISLANSSQQLKPGMSTTCQFFQSTRPVLTVPLDAVSRSGIAYSVVKISGNAAHITQVQAGDILQDRIEITGAIAEGDTVVVYGQNLLQDDSLVEIID
jgi:multidrug efflux pump subunit AcrA (membrane-fusion protein)